MYYVFGNLIREGQPLRDDADLLLSQLVVDYITSFVRSHNPNPSVAYLEARGYTSTLSEIRTSGQWSPVSRTAVPTLRQLNWPTSQQDFLDIAQCDALNLPLRYFM